jgi:hypothetical protein
LAVKAINVGGAIWYIDYTVASKQVSASGALCTKSRIRLESYAALLKGESDRTDYQQCLHPHLIIYILLNIAIKLIIFFIYHQNASYFNFPQSYFHQTSPLKLFSKTSFPL